MMELFLFIKTSLYSEIPLIVSNSVGDKSCIIYAGKEPL